ncbi:MAG: acyltransferase [Clostridiales bacterium]|nr:acyltransferase [Clostridiales bacterium]
MRLRQRLSICITAILLIVSFAAAFPVADTDGTTYSLPEGLTITLPKEFEEVYWVGMKAEDSELTAQVGLDPILQQLEESGVSLESSSSAVGQDNGQTYYVCKRVQDAPADLSESSLLALLGENKDDPDDQFHIDILEKGLIQVGGLELFKASSEISVELNIDVHVKYKAKSYMYGFVTESGKLHSIELSIYSDPMNLDETIPFTTEDLEHLDYLESYVIGSLKFDGKTVKIDAEPYPTAENKGNGQETETTATATPTPAKEETKSSNKSFFKSFTGFSFPLWILAVGLACVLIAGAKVSKRREWQEEPFSLASSKAIQGFAAVAIILHHLSQDLLEKAGPFQFLSECGVLFVGIFFFFSGYGLYTSLKTKKDYLKGFLKKRLVTILIPFYMCIAVFTIASCICGTKYSILKLVYTLSGWSLINGHMWYIVEIAILYLAFFIIFKLIKNRTAATIVMTIFVLLMMGGSLYLCHGEDFSCSYWFMGEWWYNSSLLFIVGMIVSKHQDGLRKIARKGYIVLLPLFGILTGVLGRITKTFLEKYSYWSEIPGEDPRYLDKLRCLSVQVPFILCFVFFVLLLMMKVRFGNPVLKFLGAISLELYLIHNLFLKGLSDGTIFKVSSPSMYIVLTLLMAIGAATVISGADKYLIGLLNKKKNNEPELPSSRNHSIDFMRIVMAFLVVTIHLPFAGKAGNVFITFGKTAVPFFLVICGYMLYRDDAKELMSRLLKQTRRILIFYIASNVFYAAAVALFDKVTEGKVNMRPYFTAKAIKDFLLFNFSPFSEHLWFFGSLLYALVILLILNKCKILKPAIFLGPVLIAAYVVLSHMGVGEDYQLRNAILVGLAYTMTGMLIRRYEKKILNIKFLPAILGILAVGASVAAIVELNTYKKGVAVPFVGCEILTITLVLLCLRFPNFGKGTSAEKLGRTCSLPIYIMHIFTMMVFYMTNNEAFFGRFGAVTIFVVTAVAVAIYENIKESIIKTRA